VIIYIILYYIILTFNSTTIAIILNGNIIDIHQISVTTKA